MTDYPKDTAVIAVVLAVVLIGFFGALIWLATRSVHGDPNWVCPPGQVMILGTNGYSSVNVCVQGSPAKEGR